MKKGRKIDVVSLLLIAGIAVVIVVAAVVAGNAWGKKEPVGSVSTLPAVSMDKKSIVTNNSDGSVWIRVKVDMAKKNGQEPFYLVSDTIRKNPGPLEKKNGIWIPGERGYYYYSKAIKKAGMTKRLFSEIRTRAGFEDEVANRESLIVEADAIPTEWISPAIDDCYKAFQELKGRSE